MTTGSCFIKNKANALTEIQQLHRKLLRERSLRYGWKLNAVSKLFLIFRAVLEAVKYEPKERILLFL
jgi:hypothetical protein